MHHRVLHTRSTLAPATNAVAHNVCTHICASTLFYRFNQFQLTVATLFVYSVKLLFISNRISTNGLLRIPLPLVTKEYFIRKQDISLSVFSPAFTFLSIYNSCPHGPRHVTIFLPASNFIDHSTHTRARARDTCQYFK